jgi:hypothetical protein
MFDKEIERLRRLRAAALRARAVARALRQPGDPLLNRGEKLRRVARTVSGRFPTPAIRRRWNWRARREQPRQRRTQHQRKRACLPSSDVLEIPGAGITDVRALTSAADLNDCFARSQIEIRALLAALGVEIAGPKIGRFRYRKPRRWTRLRMQPVP